MKKKIFWDKFMLFTPILVLIIISLLNMYYVSHTMEMYQNYLFKQALWFGLGFLVLFIFTILKPKIFFRTSKYLYFINVLLLILVLFLEQRLMDLELGLLFLSFLFSRVN